MTNMSYCRWENTSRDLQDCYLTFREWVAEGCPEDLSSDHEVEGFINCVRTAIALVMCVEENREILDQLQEAQPCGGQFNDLRGIMDAPLGGSPRKRSRKG